MMNFYQLYASYVFGWSVSLRFAKGAASEPLETIGREVNR